MGGLGIGNIMHKNLILLFKWWWRFSETDNSLWKRILNSVHDINGLKASSDTFQKFKGGTWAQLLSTDADTSKMRSIIEEGIYVKIGKGNSVQFWHDNWCEGGILKRAFPRLYTLSLQKNHLVNQMGVWQESSWAWLLSWRRSLYDWEYEEVQRLEIIIQQVIPDRGTEDSVIWKHSGSMVYPTKIIGTKLFEGREPILPKAVINFVWHSFIPPRAQLSVWLANLERLKTGDFLLEKGIIDSQRAACPFCNSDTESNAHLLLTCNFSWRSWTAILKWWGLSAVFQNRCISFSIQWLGLVKGRNHRRIWGLVLGCVFWSIWYERNKIKFERRPTNQNYFEYSLKIRIGIWAKEFLGLTVLPPHGVCGSIERFCS